MKKLLTRLSSRLLLLAMIIGNFAFLSSTAFAIAPAGTCALGGTTVFALNQASTALGTLTITDAGGEITAALDVHVRIPAGLNIEWDTTVTTVGITQSGAGVTATTPVYVGTTGVTFDVTTNFDIGENVQIAGLKFKSFTGVAAADTLDYAVDNATYASATFGACTGDVTQGAPTLVSASAQTFYTGMASQPLDWVMTIAESTTPGINTADDVRIKIPNAFNMAWDDTDTSILVNGTDEDHITKAGGGACTADANDCTVTVTFAQTDGSTACTAAAGDCKTMIIPVEAAFEAADDITVTGALLFDFSAESSADNLELEIAGTDYGTSATDEDAVTVEILVASSAGSSDKNGPVAPTSFAAEVNEDLQVVLTWTDPTDLDLDTIEILRGVGNFPVSGDPIATVGKGIQTYTDTDVSAGDTVKYIIRGKDEVGNSGTNTEMLTLTIEEGATAEEDTTGPVAPTEFAVSVDEDLYVVLTWTDPTDSDLDHVQVVKSIGEGLEPDTALATVEKGLETYTDGSVTEGEMLNYKLVGVDSTGNEGTYTSTLNITVEAEATGVPDDDTPVPVSFSDTSGHWAEGEVTAMATAEVVQGDPDGTFRPNGNLNRAEAAALLYRVLGLGEPSTPSVAPFTDVEISAWYAGYIRELKSLELVAGNPDSTYEPAKSINRAEFLTLAMNVYYYMSDDDTKAQIDALKAGDKTDAYEDLADAWYTPDVTAATELGFVSGSACSGGMCFNAESEVTRAEATVILYNMFYTML